MSDRPTDIAEACMRDYLRIAIADYDIRLAARRITHRSPVDASAARWAAKMDVLAAE